ncbi:MAG: hypothetical protein IKP65_06420 [Alphaproteobacteria bacterium]|nr:hypothetical protein [Alphaproteobacteria bacterium]
MNYISSLRKKKKKTLTKEEKFFLSEVERFEILLKVYKNEEELLKFKGYTNVRGLMDENEKNQKKLKKCYEAIAFIEAKLNEFYQR